MIFLIKNTKVEQKEMSIVLKPGKIIGDFASVEAAKAYLVTVLGAEPCPFYHGYYKDQADENVYYEISCF